APDSDNNRRNDSGGRVSIAPILDPSPRHPEAQALISPGRPAQDAAAGFFAGDFFAPAAVLGFGAGLAASFLAAEALLAVLPLPLPALAAISSSACSAVTLSGAMSRGRVALTLPQLT